MKKLGLPALVTAIAPDLRRFLERIRESFESPDGLVTKKELVDTKAFTSDSDGYLTYKAPAEEESCVTPPAATALSANGAMTSIMLSWDGTDYGTCYSHSQIWRASTDSLSAAVLLGTTRSGVFVDAVGSDGAFYYWVRMINIKSDIGPYNATPGVLGKTSPDVEYLLSQLAATITSGELNATLVSGVNDTMKQATAPTTKPSGAALIAGDVWIDDDDDDRMYFYHATKNAWVIASLATQAYVGDQIIQQVGYCEQTVTLSGDKTIATAYTSKDACNAAIVTGKTFSWKDDGAIAAEIKTVSTTAAGNTTTIGVHASSISGIEGKYAVKIDNAGHVTGYGLVSATNDSTPTSEFGVRADNFWIAPPSTVAATAPTTGLYKGRVWVHSTTSAVQYYTGSAWSTTPQSIPFTVKTSPTYDIDGTTVLIPAGVYIDNAYIRNAAITSAKIGLLAVDSAHIASAAITNAKVADAAITNAKIDNLDASKITAGTIHADRIGAGSIVAGKLKVTGTGAVTAGTVGARPSSWTPSASDVGAAPDSIMHAIHTTEIDGANIRTGTISANVITTGYLAAGRVAAGVMYDDTHYTFAGGIITGEHTAGTYKMKIDLTNGTLHIK